MGTSIFGARRDAVSERLAWLQLRQWEAWSTSDGRVVIRVRYQRDMVSAEAATLDDAIKLVQDKLR